LNSTARQDSVRFVIFKVAILFVNLPSGTCHNFNRSQLFTCTLDTSVLSRCIYSARYSASTILRPHLVRDLCVT